MTCKHCGAQVDSIYRICPYCNSEIEYPDSNKQVIIQNIYNGPAPNQQPQYAPPQYTPQQPYNYQQNYVNQKDKWVALLLCIFVGVFGVHNFYVGKHFKGLLYLFTHGIFGIGWIIDIISIATGNFTDSKGIPLK